jgi:23S rRNA pseudouridine2605 synthase
MKRKTDNFSKFFEKKSNSAIKEGFKQEKKAIKKERKEGIERHFEEKRQAKAARFAQAPPPQANPLHQPPPAKKFAQKPPARPSAPPPRSAPPPARRPPAKGSFAKASPAKHGPAPKGVVPKPIASSYAPPAKAAPSKGLAPKGPPAPQAAKGYPAPHAAKAAPGVPQRAPSSDLIPLNKYVAHSGICSRRDAAELIRQGKVLVNGQPVTDPGTRVSPSDEVKVNGKKITMSRNFVYILLNKPKDYITTTEDPEGRKTVLDLIRHATTERVYPVGRLDRNTSGVLLLTNDGDLAQKLAHPRHEIKKIYHVTLDKALTKADFDKIVEGVTLEDGLAHVDVIAYADARDKTQIGLEIHSGRNRIVRRIFEFLHYDVRGLDRVMYAGLTKKNVQRGKWRLLAEKEVRILKYLNSSTKSSAPRPGGSPGSEPVSTAASQPGQSFSQVRTPHFPKPTSFRKGKGAPADKPYRPAKDSSADKPYRPAKDSSTDKPFRPVRNSSAADKSYRPRKSKTSPRKGPSNNAG